MTRIRPATSADHDAIWALLSPVFRAGETYAVDPEITKAEALHYWTGQPRATYVADNEGAIVGTYYIRTNQPGGGDHICNCGFIVSEAARGQGLAEAMCRHAQGAARDLGYQAMQFNFVLASNAGALRLWQRLGFDVIGTIPAAFRHPTQGMVAAHIMYKAL